MPEDAAIDVLIIGAGFSGLAAGVRLSQFFDRVVIAESHTIAGGLNSYFYRQRGRILYNSGLHTVTNTDASNPKWGLGLICRSLELSPDQFQFAPAASSLQVTCRDTRVRATNHTDGLAAAIAEQFPNDISDYQRFVAAILDPKNYSKWRRSSAHEMLKEFFCNEQLIELLTVPVYYYAGYRERSIDFATFAIVFRSIFLDGCGSPPNIKTVLDLLQEKFKQNGGVLRFKTKVSSVKVESGRATAVQFTTGESVRPRYILSSMGLHETGKLVNCEWGSLSDVSAFETMITFSRPVFDFGVEDTLHFVNDAACFDWIMPKHTNDTPFITISSLDNYRHTTPPSHHCLKIGAYQSGSLWCDMEACDYRAAKATMEKQLVRRLHQLYPELHTNDVVHMESLSPRTIRRYTGHPNGTLYGGSEKSLDGSTPIANLSVIGNDQGGIGIAGAMISGIIVANYSILI